MKKRRFGIFMVVLIAISVSSVIFIRLSNDHKECSTVTIHTIDKENNDLVVQKHVCKEKYSF